MYEKLVPCPACARHVRAAESACPFCDAALPQDIGARAVPGTTQRLGRAAAFMFGAAIAATGCAGAVSPDGGNPADSASTTDAATTTDSGTATDAPVGTDTPPVEDCGGNAALYGLPPPPCGTDAGAPDDNGGGSADYGSPPPIDAG